MKSVLGFFEEKDYLWLINYNKYTCFLQVAEKFGYVFKIHKTVAEVEFFLKEKIEKLLSEEGVKSKDFKLIKDYLAINYYSSNRKKCTHSFYLVSLIESMTSNKIESYTKSIDSWLLIRDYLEAYLSIRKDIPVNTIFEKNKNIRLAESIIFLRKKGYKVFIGLGEINIEDEDSFFKAINYRFKKIGHNSIVLTLKNIKKYYHFSLKRFFLRIEPKAIGNSEIDIPWGYIFNLSLANMHFVKKSRTHNKNYYDCIELLKHFFCLKKIQVFSKYNDFNHNHDTILPAIQKNILYDQYFSIDQISEKHIYEMVSGIFSSDVFCEHNINIEIYLDIIKFFEFCSIESYPLFFTNEDVFNGLNYFFYKYSLEEVKSTLSLLSFKYNEVNNGYLRPEEINKKNYFEKPFISIGGGYFYASPTFNNYGFYNCIDSLYKSKGVDGNAFGKAIESFVSKLFSSSGVVVHSNIEYEVPTEIAKELSIKSSKKECDFIIETKEKIILIELKKKTLTVKARSGDVNKSLVDLSQSLLHALAQTGCHEYILRRYGMINTIEGKNIFLLNRKIERVALSLFDFFGIQDEAFVRQMLKNFLNSYIESSNDEDNKEINKYIIELQNQYQANIANGFYNEEEKRFFNCRSFSVPQLMEVLKNSKNNEDFKDELDNTRNASTGSKDWYKDYSFIRLLKNSS